MATPRQIELSRLMARLHGAQALLDMTLSPGGERFIAELKTRFDTVMAEVISEETMKSSNYAVRVATLSGAANELKLLKHILTEETPAEVKTLTERILELEAKGDA